MFRSVSSSVTSRSTSTERSGADGFEEHGSDDFEKNEFNYGDGLRPWYPCYLTLDGGGVRSYSSLLIVKALMHEVWMWENRLADEEDDEEIATEQKQPKELKLSPRVVKQTPLEKDLLPCHYFDFFYGTSSGGIIATLLGRLRMNIDDAIETFLNIMDAMYGDSARRHSLWPLSTKYSHGPLELFLNGLLGDAKFAEDRTAFSIDEPRTAQTCCLSATPSGFDGYGVAPAILLRTFAFYYSIDTPNWVTRYNEGATDLTVWQTLRATTATPFYFEATHFAA
ncbi:unnamed protein product [Zymoseptoria tritici ST99CH_1A5]|uniref:PNPLA domain-containing protein n=2 Tax=Zymoseptoria tritici TaxID=1047171 RepID=A0A2H1GFR3_ZYMTR|nr:unnamed protein product [Zymoseptoria tritici ST99CH_1E4]SMR53589.1 unnamed protein product [Zymoseptoria tritici ST99CH_3D1]SMY24270.1 unnamed protein product [Zymoseptoria tritici ST99CH_1A5]